MLGYEEIVAIICDFSMVRLMIYTTVTWPSFDRQISVFLSGSKSICLTKSSCKRTCLTGLQILIAWIITGCFGSFTSNIMTMPSLVDTYNLYRSMSISKVYGLAFDVLTIPAVWFYYIRWQ